MLTEKKKLYLDDISFFFEPVETTKILSCLKGSIDKKKVRKLVNSEKMLNKIAINYIGHIKTFNIFQSVLKDTSMNEDDKINLIVNHFKGEWFVKYLNSKLVKIVNDNLEKRREKDEEDCLYLHEMFCQQDDDDEHDNDSGYDSHDDLLPSEVGFGSFSKPVSTTSGSADSASADSTSTGTSSSKKRKISDIDKFEDGILNLLLDSPPKKK